MQLDHEFTVGAPVDEVWKAVLDPERVAPCMPGATLSSVEGDTFQGTVKVKLGPVSLLYKGSGEFLDKDEQSRSVVIKASGKDSRGAGTAAATVTVTLTPEGDSTTGSVTTDLNVTGRPAQFGRGMISDVGDKILDSFAANLAEMLTTAESGGASSQQEEPSAPEGNAPDRTQSEPAASSGQDRQSAEVIDLFDYAGGSTVKRWAPPLIGAVALVTVLAIWRVLRRR